MAAIFADIKTPYVNLLTVKRILSSAVKENIFQGIMVKPGEGVTEKYSEDTDASEIQVLRQIPTDNEAREIGADNNGGWFNNQAAATSATEAYGIQILQMTDRNIDIPTNAQDLVNIDLLEGEVRNLAGIVNRRVNAVSIAAALAKNFNNLAGFDKRNSNAQTITLGSAVASNWVTHAAGGSYVNDIIDAGANLDNGNPDQGIDAYPDSRRCVIIRPTIKADVLKGMVGLYGGTGVYDVLRRGGLDTSSRPEVATTGYVGEIANMPVYCLAATGWREVEKFLGLAVGALNDVAGVVMAADATGRALAFNSTIKTIDAPGGQGIRLQPKYRMGAECWDALGVVPIFSRAFTNPVTEAANVLYVRGAGSRASA